MDVAYVNSPKTRPTRAKAIIEALELQRLMMVDARSKDVKPNVRAVIARSWVLVQEMRLRLAMKPAPKPINVEDLERAKERRKAARAAGKAVEWRKKGKAPEPKVVPLDPPAESSAS